MQDVCYGEEAEGDTECREVQEIDCDEARLMCYNQTNANCSDYKVRYKCRSKFFKLLCLWKIVFYPMIHIITN